MSNMWSLYSYRPQRSWAKVIFSQACVTLFTGGGGGSASVHAGIPHHHHLLEQTPPGADPPGPGRHLPPGADPPGPGRPPQRRACWEIRSTRGRYASYCNAILFIVCNENSGSGFMLYTRRITSLSWSILLSGHFYLRTTCTVDTSDGDIA